MGISWNSDKIPSVKVHESKNNKSMERKRGDEHWLHWANSFDFTWLKQQIEVLKKILASKYSVIFADYFQLLSMTCWKLDILGKRKKPRWIDSLKIMSSTNKSWKWFPNGWIFWSNFVFVFLNYYCSNFFDYNSHF